MREGRKKVSKGGRIRRNKRSDVRISIGEWSVSRDGVICGGGRRKRISRRSTGIRSGGV